MPGPVAYTVCAPDCARSNPNAYTADFPEALSALAGIGYDGVELQVREPPALEIGQLRAQLDATGLGVAALATGHVRSEDGLTLTGPDDVRSRALSRMIEVIDLAAELDAVVTIGSVRGTPIDREQRAEVQRAIGVLGDHAASVDVRLVVEPQNRFVGTYLRTVADVATMLAEVDRPSVGIVADTFHMYLEEASLAAALVAAGDRLWHVQLAENHRGPLGTGLLPVRELVSTLDALDYRGWLVMEHEQGEASLVSATRSLRVLELARSDGR